MGLSPIKEGQEKFLKNTFHKIATQLNEQQLLTVTGSPGGGSFKLTAEGVESASIAYNAAAGTVESTLEALSTIGSGQLNVTGSAGGPWTVEWDGTYLRSTPIPLLTLTTNALTGGSSPSVSISRSQAGAGSIPQFYYIGLSQSTRTTLGETVALSAINETTGTGYSRQRVKNNATEWVDLYTGGYWQVTSLEVDFTATAGDWTIARSIFITDAQSGSTGYLIDVRDITAVTVGNGQTYSYKIVEPFKATA
jgi:hypothetical protein